MLFSEESTYMRRLVSQTRLEHESFAMAAFPNMLFVIQTMPMPKAKSAEA
jgi:hypothetical protein